MLLAPGIIVLGTGVRFVHFHAGYGRLRARIWRAIVAPDRVDDIPPVSVKVEINPNVEATSTPISGENQEAADVANHGSKFKDLEYAGTETAEQLFQDMFNGSSALR